LRRRCTQNIHQLGRAEKSLAAQTILEHHTFAVPVTTEVDHLVRRIGAPKRIAQAVRSWLLQADDCPGCGSTGDRIPVLDRAAQPLPFAPYVQRWAVRRTVTLRVRHRRCDHRQHAQVVARLRAVRKVRGADIDDVAAA